MAAQRSSIQVIPLRGMAAQLSTPVALLGSDGSQLEYNPPTDAPVVPLPSQNASPSVHRQPPSVVGSWPSDPHREGLES